jgi:hypothetical protein
MNEQNGLFRSDAEVALGELLEMLARAAEVHANAAHDLAETAAVAPLQWLAGQRAEDRDAVLAAGLESGAAPSEPDPERVAAEGLLERLRSVFSLDESQAATRVAREVEGLLAGSLETARRHEQPEAVARVLADLAERQARVRETLSEAERAAEGGD